MSEKKKSIPIKKIVYFDEGSAIDYLDITNGGLKMSSEEDQANTSTAIGASAEGGVGTGIAFKALSPFLNIKADSKASADISRLGESIVRTTISNTVLSDYIKIADEDNSIEKIKGYNVSAYEGSISFIKMYSPYFSMVNMNDEAINISKIDEVLEKGKGYYELIAEKADEKKVLRFNIKAFRNNYSLVDLTRMNLEFYAIEVGKMDLAYLDAKKEFSSIGNDGIVTANNIIGSSEKTTESSEVEENNSIVYDVILAGISSNE